MVVKYFTIFAAVMTIAIAAPQHFRPYFKYESITDERKHIAPAVGEYKHHQNVEYDNRMPLEYTFKLVSSEDINASGHQQSSELLNEQPAHKNTAKGNGQTQAHFIAYSNDDSNQGYKTLEQQHNSDVYTKQQAEQKYFKPSSAYSHDGTSEKYAASEPLSAKQSTEYETRIVYQPETQSDYQEQQHQAEYEQSYEDESAVKYFTPSHQDYTNHVTGVKSSPHSPSAIYYQQMPQAHGEQQNEEPKYIVVKAEGPKVQQESEIENAHAAAAAAKTIKYSDAATSSHVSFNGLNTSYHY